ncbi:unnamed protein product [Rotaria sordida]|uniref:Uncharacterized protein n=1 Tax=Rotaria sordida TaxID=392033 RepID=A0A815H307_9BILA|nr:unnamed protein product [Rotaria sordida]
MNLDEKNWNMVLTLPTFYVRHNHAKQENLNISDLAVDIQLLNMNGRFVSSLSHSHSNRPLLIIAEAYALDEWPIGSRICYVQPKCDNDRIRITDDFIKATKYRIPLLIDPISENNLYSKVYCPWPIRFYVIDHMKKLSCIAQPIQDSFSLELIKNALDDAIQQCQ